MSDTNVDTWPAIEAYRTSLAGASQETRDAVDGLIDLLIERGETTAAALWRMYTAEADAAAAAARPNYVS